MIIINQPYVLCLTPASKFPCPTYIKTGRKGITGLQSGYVEGYHWVYSQYENLKAKGQGSQSNINKRTIEGYPIPIPPLEVQQKIVSILDRFDALCHDLTQGLPAEIAARKKQYEYYRDKLLTFPRKGA